MPVTDTADGGDQMDVDQSGPSESLSMSALEGNLPHMQNMAEGVASIQKRKRDMEQEEENRKKKSRREESVTFIEKTIPSATSDTIKEAEEYDCRKIVNPERRLRCAFKYEDADGNSIFPIGNLWHVEYKGWSIHLVVDAGRWGSASLSLIVRLNKGKKDVPLSKDPKDYFEFEVTWRVGVSIDGRKVIETLAVDRAMRRSRAPPYNVDIVDSCPQGQLHKLERLAGIVFKCNSAKVSRIEETWLEGLDDRIKDGLKNLFLRNGTHTMTIWFLPYPDVDTAIKDWADELESSVTSGFSAFWQYKTTDNEPNFSIEHTKPIRTFNKEMYVKYCTQKNGNGTVRKLKDGRVAEDKTQVVGYHGFKKQLIWEVPYEFAVYNIIPVIRDVQFEMGKVAHLSRKPQLVHLQALPTFTVKGPSKQLTEAFKGYVRITTIGAVPRPGATIRAQWDNLDSRVGKSSVVPEHSKGVWQGIVMKDVEGPCEATGTNFCVLFTKPYGGQIPRTYEKEVKYPDDELVLAHIQVVVDTRSAQREIEGMQKLADLTSDFGELAPARMALMSDPSHMKHTLHDLTAKNPNEWEKREKILRMKYADSPAHLDVFTSIKEVKNKLTACVGPSGTGKTRVLADFVNAAAMCGHTVLVCAVSNKVVDQAANSCWKNFPPEERHNFKFLRYDTASAEMQAYFTREDTKNPVSQDPNARPTYKAATSILDDDVIAQTLAEAAALQSEHTKQLAALYDVTKDYPEALLEKQKIDSRKKSKVKSAMTLAHRVFDLITEDEYQAHGDYQADLKAYRADKLDDDAIEQLRLNGDYRSEEELVALGQDKLDEAEITARLEDGRILSIDQRDKSFEYRKRLSEYCSADGNVSENARNALMELRIAVVLRVLRATQIMFTTCKNVVTETMKLAFSPDVIYIDGAERLTMAALAHVMTSFEGWLATIIFGDPAQLLPFRVSGGENEFRENATLSALGLLEEKGYPILRLLFQYRMAPSIAEWVSKFLYKGLMKNHDSVIQDNRFREIARDISRREYGRKGPERKGSEYWTVDVVNGVSQGQSNGASLLNHANADRIATLVDQTLSRGVKASKITVLVYYSGQLPLVSRKIDEKVTTSGRMWPVGKGVQISTVDSFQGENEFVFLDIVAAPQQAPQTAAAAGAKESEEDVGSENDQCSGRITAYVKSANRLCSALTRGRSCVVVVCQLTALLAAENTAVSAMAQDFLDRKLVYHDDGIPEVNKK